MAEKEYKRPSPEALLELARKEESQAKRGKLTIYFGAAPGVGKTYAMLTDAQLRKKEGIDVAVGYVETHGRAETDALLEGLESIPPLVVKYVGVPIKEVDLGKVFARKPQLVLVDELAHSDAPGLRNAKRYQDVEEILNAGIDVYTTMNVQHVESLNDIVHQITNIRVRETVPDNVIEGADEIKLVDLPPEELIKRLHDGKVYVKDMAISAADNFFRPGNLLALRQMALRSVAGSVDGKMRSYMRAHAIAGPWSATERVLVGVFASPYAEKLVRSAFRLANEIDAEWIAFYVETERHKRLSEKEKEWLNKALDLAKQLGARLVWIKGSDVTEEITDYARSNNVTKIVIGKPRRFGLYRSIPKELLTKTPNVDLYLLDAKIDPKFVPKKRISVPSPLNYAIGIVAVGIVSLIAFLLRTSLDQVNLLFMLLLPVILSALYLGRGPSIVAALTSIMIFDYLFISPNFSFAVVDVRYLVSFIVYIIVALAISNLASQLRGKVVLLKQSEVKNIAIYGLSRDLVTAHTEEQVLSIMVRHTLEIFPCEMAIFLPEDEKLTVKAKTPDFGVTPKVLGVASWVLINRQAAGRGTSTLPQARAYYLPMLSGEEIIGVAGFDFRGNEEIMTTEKRAVLKTIVRLGAMALERIRFQ
ncbi:MAG TPA: sensor histidine kinase KdpD [Nitrospiraceae bacterium]|jgi:two-component system sensor histidine kinase KdpD|nr:sensor histidine kinase KdpD [Nitrospiraceae bacterium]